MRTVHIFFVLLIALAALMTPPLSQGVAEGGGSDPSQPASAAIDLTPYAGKVVYLDFWASWCGPCKKSFPWMNALQQKHGERGLVVVTVNVDRKKEDAEKFLKQQGSSVKVLYDPEGKIAARYGLKAMPSSFLYDRAGTLRETIVGFHSDEVAKVEKSIEALLSEEAPDAPSK